MGVSDIIRRMEMRKIDYAIERLKTQRIDGFIVPKGKTKDTPFVKIDTPLEDVLKMMQRREVKSIPVIDDSGALRGKIRLSNVMKIFVHKHHIRSEHVLGMSMDFAYFAQTAIDLMDKYPAVIRKGMTVGEAAHMMSKFGTTGLPVVDERGNYIGMLHADRILKKLFKK